MSCEMLAAQAGLDAGPSERGLDEYPSEWLADFRRFSEALFDLSARYGDSVMFRIFDPRSLQGLVKAIRYRAQRYPTFVVGGDKKVVGLDMPQLEQTLLAIGASLQAETSAAARP